MKKEKGFWNNYENAYEVAKKCQSLVEFKKQYYQAWFYSKKNNWLNDFNWLNKLNKWNYETCIEESKKYKTRTEFQKNNGSAYTHARKHNYLKDMIWLTTKCKENGYWKNKNNCIEESKKYKTRTEFQKGCIGAYVSSRVNGWLDEMIWLKTIKNEIDINLHNHLIYSYEIKSYNSVYVGLTNDIVRRHKSHNKKNRGKYDTIKQFCINNKIELPTPKILEINLNYSQAQDKEKQWAEKYKKDGWQLLNKAQTGINVSSIGGNLLKWTKEKVFEESKKYTTLIDFIKNARRAYKLALVNKWLDDFTWLKRSRKPITYWDNYDNFIELSKSCKTIKELRKKSDSAYRAMLKHNWKLQ